MGDIGERLRAAREERGLTLPQAAEQTRIPLNCLQALEGEQFSVFTSDLHARGFLRSYSRFLGVDSGAAIDSLSIGGAHHHKKQPGAAVPDLTPAGHVSMFAIDIVLVIVVLLVVALGVYSFRQRQVVAVSTPTPVPLPSPTVTPMPVYDGTAYTLDIYLDYTQHKLDVRQRIDYTNATSQTLENLVLNVHPNHSRGTFKLNSLDLEIDGGTVRPEVSALDVRFTVSLPRGLKPDEHVAVILDYSLSLPKISPTEEFSGGGFGYSRQSVSLGNWYPVLAPYREDKGWFGLTYFPVGDPYVTEVADYRVTITTTENVVIAGTGVESRNGNAWLYEAKQARSFAFAASDRYLVADARAGDATAHIYYFPEDEVAAQAALAAATKALTLFSDLLGAYPYADYRMAETEFAGGMEFTGLTFLGSVFLGEYDGTNQTPLIPLTVHEVSHQWFYSLVGSDQVTEPWLDEAVAEYCAFLYYERNLPEDTDWWWGYAVDQWAPTGKIDSLIYEFRDNRQYVDAVYRRGAQFVRDLRQAMGDPAFFAFLKEYQRRFAYRIARSRDFFGLVREFTTADLVPLQEEYFRQRILP